MGYYAIYYYTIMCNSGASSARKSGVQVTVVQFARGGHLPIKKPCWAKLVERFFNY